MHQTSFRLITALVVMTAIPAFSQKVVPAPFAELERQVKTQLGGWDGDKRILSRLFDNERHRLGDQFEVELLNFVAGDPERHYWIAVFLEEPAYLHGSKPLTQLSLKLMVQGIGLLRGGNPDEENAGQMLAFNVLAAVLSQKLGLRDQATQHKSEAELALAKNPDLRLYYPAMSEEYAKIYDGVAGEFKEVRTSLPASQDSDRPKTRLSAGVLNGRATNLPRPAYPAALRDVTGQVTVSIVVDEKGKVIWAKAISGAPPLQKLAEEAAWKAEFTPIKLEGTPEKVSGVLIFNFVNY